MTRLRSVALLVPALLALAGLTAPASAADAGPTLRPAGDRGGVEAVDPAPPAASHYRAGRYVVVLRDPAAASYAGGIRGLKAVVGQGRSFRADAARTVTYTEHLADVQGAVADSVGARPLVSYSLTTNGFAADLTAKQAARLAADPRVGSVVEDELLHLADASTSTGYLGLEGDDGVWDSVGGVANAGKGIVVGVIDSGIAPENPSFAGAPLGKVDGAAPFKQGSSIVFHKSDGTDFRGTCVSGVQFTQAACTTKVVGAQFFVDGFGADNIGGPSVGEYLSPRDGSSHGSHTTSTAAGDADVDTGGGHISGVTPAAKVAMYKACWSGPVAESDTDDGCATADLLSAIEAAVADNVDVINYSIGGGAAQTTNSLTDQAFMSAASAGIFVAAAGGNAGPDASTLDNASPWITTVAASTIPAPEGTVVLGDGQKLLGATVTVPGGGLTGPLVDSVDAAAAGATGADLCRSHTLDPAKAAGKIVLCDRGEIDRTLKSAEVKRAGGIGMVLVNPTPSSTDLDAHTVPTVHLDADSYDAVHEYAGTPGATATLQAGNQTGHASVPVPQVAGFSSRGPVEADGSDLVKPDVAAPGVSILAATANAAGSDPTWGHMSGTSMASPHVAGLGALYLSQHPEATPAEIKSAIMTSATDTVDADGQPLEQPFAQGNGQVRPTAYLDPGLLYLNDVDDWQGYLASIGQSTTGAAAVDGSDLNLASIGIGGLAGTQTVTRTVTATRAGTWTASVAGLPGATATVEPSTLTFAEAGEQHTFTVTIKRTDAPLGDFTTGYLTWTDGDGATARSSLAVRPVAFDAAAEVAGTGTSGSASFTAHVGDDAEVALTTEGLARGSRVEGTGAVGGPTHRYAVTVPDGATFARFDLDAADDSSDLDMLVYRRSESGALTLVDTSATGSADERVDLTDPTPGTYVVEVDFYAAGTAGADLDYALTSYVLDPAHEQGGLTVDPTSIDGHVGDVPTLTASWSGLEPGAYLGRVRFGDTGISTVVAVDAGADVPVGPGTPTLSVDPDATGWVGRGTDLTVSASGLTPGATYAASVEGTTLRTGPASSAGRVDWSVTITDDIAAGPHTLTLAGPGTSLTAGFRVTPIQLVSAFGFPQTAFDGTPYARLDITYGGHGDLRYEIASATSGHVYLSKQEHVGEVVGVPTWNISSPYVKVGDEELVGRVTVVMDDGSDGPTLTTEPFTADVVEPGTITFAPTAADPDLVDVTTVNHSFSSYNPMVRYRGCDGRYVVANGFLKEDGTTVERWDLTGFTSVEVVDSFGTVLARHQNAGPGRCDTAGIHPFQDYWGTLTATPTTAAAYDPSKPITFEVSNRYDPTSSGFDLAIGEGEKKFDQDPFFYEAIPTQPVAERGPVVSRKVQVAAGVAHWASSTWEGWRQIPGFPPPGIHYQATAWVELPKVTVADLAPQQPPATITAATPKVTGGREVGSVLRAVPGTWKPGNVTLAYQWLRDGTPIAGARQTTYRLSSKDATHRVAVRVTGTLGTASASRTSSAVTVLGHLTATPRPAVRGTLEVGKRLTARTGTWRPGHVTLTVVWLRDGHRVGHGLHYTVRKADRGHRITVRVTGHRNGYVSVTRTSAARRVR